MSRNLPMSNSELKKAIEIEPRTADRPCPGCSPSVMWARLSSQRTSRSSGNCVEVLGEVLDRQREPVGLVWTAGGSDRQDARALAAAHDAVVVLAAAQRRHSLEKDERVEADFGKFDAPLEPFSRLLENVVAAPGLAVVVQNVALIIQRCSFSGRFYWVRESEFDFLDAAAGLPASSRRFPRGSRSRSIAQPAQDGGNPAVSTFRRGW